LTSYLITTTDRSRWPDSGHLVFIGTFCLPDDPDSLLDRYTYEIADTEVTPVDKNHYFELSKSLHSTLSRQLALALNQFHQLNESERYWSIITGVWLRSFIDLVVSRAVVLTHIKKQYNEIILVSVEQSKCVRAANYFSEFHKFMKAPNWNSLVISDIWSDCASVESATVQVSEQTIDFPLKVSTVAGTKFVLTSTYLPRFREVLLNLMLGSWPHRINVIQPPIEESNADRRRELHLSNWSFDAFEKIMIEFVRNYLPTVYLEGFNKLELFISQMNYPETPRAIFTSNRHLYDDVFNVWVAKATSRGTCLILGQHGGNYGISKYPSFAERHEISVADKYVTWGWNSEGPTIPGIVFTKVGARSSSLKKKTKITLVTDHLWAVPRSIWGDTDESSPYLTHITEVLQLVSPICQQHLHVRLHHGQADTGHSLTERWKHQVPQLHVDSGSAPFKSLMQESKLLIVAHNSTTFPETFAMGIPTIITWKPSWTEIRDEAQPFFEKLAQVGIFHADPKTLAAHLSKIYDDIDGWWESKEVTEARQLFCEHFSRMSKRPLRLLRHIITQQQLPKGSES
jgi:putative transferase (TIGR04331 family)